MEADYDPDYYERCYRDYAAQNPPRKLAFYASLLVRHLAPGLPRRIHDVGCGPGSFLASLPADWERHGSDPNPRAIERARAADPALRLQVGGVETIPPGAPFSMVTALDVIEHVPDPEAARDALARQLVPGGLLLLVVPVYDGLSGPIIRALDRDETHLHRWPRRRWLAWAEPDFELLEWAGILRYPLPAGPSLHVPTRRFRDHTPAIFVVARRGHAS